MRKWTLLAGAFALVISLPGEALAQTTAVPPVAAPTATGAPATAPTLDEILAKHLATKGGLEKWKGITSQKMTGVAVTQGFELALVVYGQRPNLTRQELTLAVPGQQPQTIVTLFDGTKAWTIDPTRGNTTPQEVSAAENAIAAVQSDFDGVLVDYKAKGYTVTLEAPGTVAGKPAHHLKVARADVPTQHFYLDPVTFVEMKISTEGANASDTELTDYRDVEGVMVPHVIKISQAGAVQAELRITKVEFNLPLDAALFKAR